VTVVTHQLSDEVLRACALLSWHGGATADQRCAVVGFDGSASSGEALAYAGGWAERNQAAVVAVHVDAAAGATLVECDWAIAGYVASDIPPPDFSADVDEAMAYVSAGWAYMSVRGDVADQLEHVARALHADVIVVGRSARPRLRIGHSVARRLLTTSRHVIVVV
jgi:nucleotide-binding universal stress UspA family protein